MNCDLCPCPAERSRDQHGANELHLCPACANAFDRGRGYERAVQTGELHETERWRRVAFELLKPFADSVVRLEHSQPVHFTERQLRETRDFFLAYDTYQRVK